MSQARATHTVRHLLGVQHPGTRRVLIMAFCDRHLPHVIFEGLAFRAVTVDALWKNYCDECEFM